MDRKGFELIDEAFKEDLNRAQEKITQKWEEQYSKKSYVGSKEQQQKARLKDDQDKQQKINDELLRAKAKLDKAHFQEDGREKTLKNIEQKERVSAKLKEAALQMQNKKGRGK